MQKAGMVIDRRTMLRGAGSAGVAGMANFGVMPASIAKAISAEPQKGWQEGPMRWFQLAFTEDDPGRFSPKFWMDYLREIHADGVCLSAGGGIAFYPTKVPWHGTARGLGQQDPFGEMARACKAAGMRVLARVDSHAMTTEAFNAHPEWAACSADGKARRHWTAPDLYLTCPYTDYNFKFMPEVLREIATNYPVDGFFGNRVNTLGVCYCEGCRKLYREAGGQQIPVNLDPIEPAARDYWTWVNKRGLELNDAWNASIRKIRPFAFFVSGTERRGTLEQQGRDIGSRYPMVFCDRQARSTDKGLYTTGEQVWNSGRFTKELRAYMGDKPVSNIISVGVEEEYRWKDSVQEEPEIRIWAASAIAQGSRPWITKFNAKPFDKRWMPVVSSIYRWHHQNERYLRNTANLARIGMILDTRGPALLGGNKGRHDIEQHRFGFYEALLESRLPFDELDVSMVDADHLARFRVVVLPNVAMLSDAQCAALRAFVNGGGRIVATHATSLYDEQGKQRTDFGLADLFGCRFDGKIEDRVQNSYLTLRHPHPALAGLEDTPRVIGAVKRVMVTPTSAMPAPPLTLVPSYQDLPMERVFTSKALTDIPMAFCHEVGKGRVVYLPMDIDRTFAEIRHGGHLDILRAMVNWAADEVQPMTVTGPGLVDMAIWRQQGSLAAHLVNYNNAMAMGGAYREALTTGPYEVSVELPEARDPARVTLLENGNAGQWRRDGARLSVTVPSITYHEVVAIDLA